MVRTHVKTETGSFLTRGVKRNVCARGVFLHIAGGTSLRCRGDLRVREGIVGDEDGREELIFVSNPFQVTAFVLLVIVIFVQFVDVAVLEHIL